MGGSPRARTSERDARRMRATRWRATPDRRDPARGRERARRRGKTSRRRRSSAHPRRRSTRRGDQGGSPRRRQRRPYHRRWAGRSAPRPRRGAGQRRRAERGDDAAATSSENRNGQPLDRRRRCTRAERTTMTNTPRTETASHPSRGRRASNAEPDARQSGVHCRDRRPGVDRGHRSPTAVAPNSSTARRRHRTPRSSATRRTGAAADPRTWLEADQRTDRERTGAARRPDAATGPRRRPSATGGRAEQRAAARTRERNMQPCLRRRAACTLLGSMSSDDFVDPAAGSTCIN